MPRGAAVIPYRCRRGVVWRIKYVDADGRQVKETVGGERDGVTEKQARSELRERLVRVERKGYRRPRALSFTAYADTWFVEGKALGRSFYPDFLPARLVHMRLSQPSPTPNASARQRTSGDGAAPHD